MHSWQEQNSYMRVCICKSLDVLFSIKYNNNAQASNGKLLQLGVVIQQNGNHPHIGEVSPHPSHDVLLVKPFLPTIVQPTVMALVVVPLCQDMHFSFRTWNALRTWFVPLMHLDDPMNYRDVPPLNLEDAYITGCYGRTGHC